tara:strand:- start:764 stop:940 length:177 start_codon:yes stop_codon:yes gene_type:complete
MQIREAKQITYQHLCAHHAIATTGSAEMAHQSPLASTLDTFILAGSQLRFDQKYTEIM